MSLIKEGTAAWLIVIGNSHFMNFTQLSILFLYLLSGPGHGTRLRRMRTRARVHAASAPSWPASRTASRLKR